MSWLQTEVLGVGSAPRTEGHEAREDSMRALVFSTKDSGHQAQGSPVGSEVGVQGLEGKSCPGVTGGAVLKCVSEVYTESQSLAVSRWAAEALGEGEVFRGAGRVGRGAAPVNSLGPSYFSGLSALSHWFILSLSPFCSFCIPHLSSLN